MSDDDENIRTKMPGTDEVKQGQRSRPALTDERAIASLWLCDGLQAYEADKQAAYDLEVDPGYLSHMRTGVKPVSLLHIARLGARKLTAFQKVVESMAIDGHLVAVPLRLELELKPGEAAALRHTRSIIGPAMWPSFLQTYAMQAFGCEGKLLEVALDLESKMGK